MNFPEFWQDRVAKGTPDTAANRMLAELAWDAALCAASAGCLESGKLIEAQMIHAKITNLHTWCEGGEQ